MRMNGLECAGNACPAMKYCQAITANGVDIYTEETCRLDEVVNVSSRMVGRDRISFSDEITSNPNSTLLSDLGSAAANALKREVPKEIHELIQLHENRLDAKISMWRAMLGATRQGRQFTHQELKAFETVLAEKSNAISSYETDSVAAVFATAAFDQRCLDKYNLMLDTDTEKIVDEVVGNMMDGSPTLLKGDKGIAKTAVAKFVSFLNTPDKDPLLIPGNGDMTTSELMGQYQLKDGETYFEYGIIPMAAQEGRIVIIDEGDASDASVMLRLQDILLNMKPGKTFILQENGGEEIKIQPGFGIISTANEASKRYKHRQTADPANRDRYDIIPFNYPDIPVTVPDDILDRDITNLRRLAYAAISDKNGRLSGTISGEEVERIVLLASATQFLYSQPASSATERYAAGVASTTAALNTAPLMNDCITPRRLFKELTRIAPANKPNSTFDSLLERMFARLDEGDKTSDSKIARNLWEEIKKIDLSKNNNKS